MGYNKCTGRDEHEALRTRGFPNKVFALESLLVDIKAKIFSE